ncbi:hypothetical protein PHISP_05211 [Aspergillus sp. HF37]|nr:hypothetical protein PHISP_05211 [Aspergillus sp. HF37]
MKSYYQVVTTPTSDTPGTTILLHFDDKRYLFGHMAEGTQRAATERGVRFSNLSDIFITGRTEWATNGGMIGTIMTQADMRAAVESSPQELKNRKDGEPHPPERIPLTIHGGHNLTHTLATGRRFIFRKGMPISLREYGSENLSRLDTVDAEDPFEQPTWSDHNIKVWAMPLSPSSTRECSPQSPRKRSHDEFKEHNAPDSVVDQWTRDNMVRNGVISDMFHSSWRADALVERRLKDVIMPAKIFIRNPETKDIQVYKGPAPGDKVPLPDIKVLVRRPWPGAEIEKLPPTTRCDEAISYIVRNHDLRGRFDPSKAQALKVPKGPAYKYLTNGDSVQSEDGKTITPDMVLGQTRIGKGAAIIDLPTTAYVDNLVNRPEWNSPAVTTALSTFFWILGPGVGEHPKLREFVAKFPQCKHVVSSTDYCPNYLALAKVAESSIRLARLKGDNYSIPVHDNVTLPQAMSGSVVTKDMINNAPFESADPGLTVDMEPTFGLSRKEVVPRLNAAELIHRIPRAVEQRMTTIRHRVQKPPFQKRLVEIRKGLRGADAEVIVLGTGSSAPSKYRNVSATLVNVPDHGYYLLDCGEATLGQLKRIFDPDQLRHVLQNLRMIWISHLHADHHLGTVSMIKAWYRENYGAESSATDSIETDMSKVLQEKRLFVVSDEMMILWLEEYAAVENFGFNKLVPLAAASFDAGDRNIRTEFTYRHCRADGTYPGHETLQGKPDTTTLSFDESLPHARSLRAATGLSDLLTARVHHCRGALGLSLVFPGGFKLSYSGDCRPSQRFATIGHGSSLLIHEATFQDEMQGSAYAKKHSTTAEALEVARRMEAHTVLLTHFSQRYQKAALVDQRAGISKEDVDLTGEPAQPDELDIPDDAEDLPTGRGVRDEIKVPNPAALYELSTPVAAAFDYMRIRVGDIPIAQAFEPVLIKLFSILEEQATRQADIQKVEAEKAKAGTGKKGKKRVEAEAAKAAAAAAKNKASGKGGDEGKGEDEAEKMDTSPEDLKKDVDLFEASESEPGWDTSEPEDEPGPKQGRGRGAM